MYLDKLVLIRKETGDSEAMWGAGVSRGAVTVLSNASLMLDSLCNTPHVQVTVVALQLPSKVAESA